MIRLRIHGFLISALAALLFLPGSTAAQGDSGEILVHLDAQGFDLEVDAARQRLYVSIPTRNEVVIIDMTSGAATNRIRMDHPAIRSAIQGPAPAFLVGTRPFGLDISLDGDTLFVALNQASTVVYVNLDTLELTPVVIGQQLGHATTFDVIEGKPNRIFASASPSSGGFAWIAMIKRDEGNAASRVASNRIIRDRPTFARSPDHEFLYVSEGFSPNSLYKLDLSLDDAPIVLEDDHGSVSGTEHLEVSPDGERIYLGSGQVLQTSDFVQIGLVGSGIPRLSSQGDLAYVAVEPGSVEVFETTFFTKVDEIELPCSLSNIRAFHLLNDGQGFLVLGDDQVCGLATTTFQRPTCSVSPSYADDTLTLAFQLASPSPAVWNFWASGGNEVSKLWSVPIPAVDPRIEFDLPIAGIPPVGTIGFLSTLVTPQGITCSDWEVVDTGTPASISRHTSLRELLLP